jgi:hypothetical protein
MSEKDTPFNPPRRTGQTDLERVMVWAREGYTLKAGEARPLYDEIMRLRAELGLPE